MKKCPHCNKDIKDNASFCPFCGEDLNKESLSQDDSLHCPYCHSIIHNEDTKCPQCKKRLKFSDRLHINEKKGYIELLLSGFGLFFCIFPYIGLSISILTLILTLKDLKNPRGFDAFVFSIIAIVINVIMIILIVLNMLANVRGI